MQDLLSDMKLDSLVNVEKEEVVSLVELLLGEQAAIYNKEKERAKNTSTPGVKVKSRRQRRKSGRSAKTKNKQKSKTGSSVQKMEQLRVAKQRQERRKQALLAYQLQSGQRRIGDPVGRSGDATASKRVAKKDAEKAANSIEINAALRPVILGLIDFQPIFDSDKNVTSVGNCIKAKRAARAMHVENLLDIDTSEEMIGELDWLAAHIKNLTQQQEFFSSLDANNIEMYEEALSAFEFDSTSVSSASNTEVLYTFIRDYCYSLSACTPRLLEMSDREFEAGARLPSYPNSPNRLRKQLKTSRACMSTMYSIMSEDNEIALKHLLATISREYLVSFNKKNGNIPDDDESIYPRSGAAYKGWGFCSALNIRPAVSRMRENNNGVSSSNIFGKFNLNGILYPSTLNRKRTAVYPFEKSELITNSRRYAAVDSAPDQIKKLYKSEEPSIADGPYSEISTRWAETEEFVNSLLTNETLELGSSPGSEVLELILRNVVLECLEKLPQSSSSTASISDAIQIAWLCAAGRDNSAWKWLFLFLAFLQDQFSGAAITGDTSDISALAHVVKKDSSLINMLGKPSSSGTKTQFFSVPESSVRVSPKPEDWENPTTIEPMEVTQKTDIAEGESSENTSLQSYFGLSWEEVCDKVTMGIRDKLSTSTKSTSSELSGETSVKLDDIKDSLMALSTSGDSIFANLLGLLDDVNYLFLNGSIDELELTTFTQIPSNRMHGAIILAAAKVSSFYIDDLTNTSGTTSAVYETEASSVSSLTGKASIATLAGGSTAKLIGPRMAASWTSPSAGDKIAPAGLSMTFSYAGVTDRIDALSTFLDSEEQNSSTLEESSSAIARIFTALDEDHEFAIGFISSLSKYFSNVSDNYTAVVDSLSSDIDDETEGTQSLRERIEGGLPMSTDMCKMLLNYIRVYDSSDATYREIRTRDKLLACSNMTFMSTTLQEEDFCEANKLKYAVVGIPAGLLDMTKEEPIDLDDVDRELSTTSNENFLVSIEKVDLTRPELEYVDKEYSFSRNLFINRVDDSTEGELIVNFDSIDGDFSVTEETESGLSEEKYTDEQINNLKNDFALKLYSDIFLDLDFFPDAYPNGTRQRRGVLTGSISMPALDAVNKDESSFLSGSNIAFDTDDRKVEAFTFYNENGETLDMNLFKGLDPVAFSVYSYLNSYGAVASAADKKESLKYGTIFERVLAIPFDPSSFEVEISTDEEDSASVNAKNNKLTESEAEVGVGLETSQGVELANYRVYVTIPETESEESTQ